MATTGPLPRLAGMAMQDDLLRSTEPGPTVQVIPLAAEELVVTKNRFVSGRVNIDLRTGIREEQIDELLTQQSVEIERIAVNREIDAIPDIREENGATIIPVVEEHIIVQRKLILKEEIHLHHVTTQRRHVETVVLRAQTASIRRTGPDGSALTPGTDPTGS